MSGQSMRWRELRLFGTLAGLTPLRSCIPSNEINGSAMLSEPAAPSSRKRAHDRTSNQRGLLLGNVCGCCRGVLAGRGRKGSYMTAGIGHNQPPTPFAAHEANILDLMELASGTLAGVAITTQEQADAVDSLLGDIKDAAKALEETRKAENKPFDDGKAAVQTIAKPLAAKLDIAKNTALDALTPFLRQLQAEKDAASQGRRLEAEKLEREALEAFKASDVTDLDARIAADALADAAKKAKAAANKIERGATGMRTYHTATVTDHGALLAWVKKYRPDDLKGWLDGFAQSQCNAGNRIMAGVLIETEKRAI